MHRYIIGDIQFVWESNDIQLEKDDNTDLFSAETEEWKEDALVITYKNQLLQLDQFTEVHPLKRNSTYEIYETEKGLFIVYHWAQCRYGFGYWLEDLHKSNMVSCYFHRDMKNQIPLSAVRFFSCAGMHSKLLQHGAMILHASYIDWNGTAVLFTAPSQTGKSTQADLWSQYAGAEIMNGDRALLRKRNNVWHSYGYPCCGSSRICINRTLPLKAIVVLEQGKDNKIISLSHSEKVRALISGTEFFLWSEYEMNLVLDLVEVLIKEIEVIKLVCRPDEQAVGVLKEYLEGNNNGKDIGLSISESINK